MKRYFAELVVLLYDFQLTAVGFFVWVRQIDRFDVECIQIYECLRQ